MSWHFLTNILPCQSRAQSDPYSTPHCVVLYTRPKGWMTVFLFIEDAKNKDLEEAASKYITFLNAEYSSHGSA